MGTPFIPPREVLHASLDAILDARRLSNDGPFVQELEHRLAELHGVRQAVAMGNATVALQVLLRALGLQGEILLPSFTFIATAHAVSWEQLGVHFVDIDAESHCIDPHAAAAAVGPRTAAIIGVHLWGQPCDVERLAAVASRAGLPLILDAAQALGASPATFGSGALASVLSLHATKIVSGLEGGAVLTNDDGLAATLRRMRNFGFAGYDTVVSLGTNAKLNEFSAAFALGGLACLEGLIQRNSAIQAAYQEGLAELPGVIVHGPSRQRQSNHHYVVVMIDDGACPLSRDELLQTLWADNILARRYFYPGCHRMEPYRSDPSPRWPSLPVTEDVAGRVLVLPAGSAVTMDDIDQICQRIRQALEQAPRVRGCLAGKAITPSGPEQMA
ncbi:MAG: DegT/DnrJ/EryC1/StrS family aminotransferase [Cyanobacteriota bacterium]|nr:DegT/DnrJ/EryC1/StrS family aminotransferase [Cyanobacteriota bacterium]